MCEINTNEISAPDRQHNQIQVNCRHYNIQKYVDIARWSSYFYQIKETLELKPVTVLIIGIGDNVVGNVLSIQQGIDVFTYDFDKELNPDFVGDITEIDTVLGGKQFDAVLACQILEHLPYSRFEEVLKKLRAVGKHVIISLPHTRVNLTFSVKLHHRSTGSLHLGIFQWWKELICKEENVADHKKPWWRMYKKNPEHYWEIGKGQYTKRKIRKSIEKYFSINKCFLATGNHDHIFYVLS
jgi:hypothetical protein